MKSKFVLMIHGGCGELTDFQAKDKLSRLPKILQKGKAMLDSGKPAIKVVEYCVSLLENDPLFNAGRGSVLNEDGVIELDAAIMDGQTLSAGAVAGVKNIQNPIKLARAIMKESKYVMLIGEGASKFAKIKKIKFKPQDYFLTGERIEQWKAAKASSKQVLDHSIISENDKKYGTVGAVAIDIYNNLAAATSTGGIVNKRFGRVGDTPIIGAGTFADNETCAVSATGFGEQFIQTVLAKTISDIIYYKKVDAQKAAELGIEYLVRKVRGKGGVIVVDHKGNFGSAFSTPKMIRGWIDFKGSIHCKDDH